MTTTKVHDTAICTENDGQPCDQCAWANEQETKMNEPTDSRLQAINDVRSLLDWLESHPEVDLPYDFDNGFLVTAPTSKEELATLARSFGECEKQFVEDSFYLRKRFGTASLYAFTQRNEVCERVVIGTEEVPEQVIPASVREIVEWRCAESLLFKPAEADANA